MKIFAEGVQVCRFLDGRWRLTDAEEKYGLWKGSLKNPELAERLFLAALNLAEDRRGGLLVVLDDPRSAATLVSSADLLQNTPNHDDHSPNSKDQLHYLLRNKGVKDLPASVLETVARMDGAVVLDGQSNLLAVGAILHHQQRADLPENVEGGRTTAGIAASHFGSVLKVSEDGLISFFQKGKCVWDM